MGENAEVKHLLDESKYLMIKTVELIFALVFRKRWIISRNIKEITTPLTQILDKLKYV